MPSLRCVGLVGLVRFPVRFLVVFLDLLDCNDDVTMHVEIHICDTVAFLYQVMSGAVVKAVER